MDFRKNFCSSPWFHMRIDNSGQFGMCRWDTKDPKSSSGSITDTHPLVYFQHNMRHLRRDLLSGTSVPECAYCQHMEQHKKISGRQKQLLKIGVNVEDFDKTMLSSPWLGALQYSEQHHGITDQHPQDWQINLGNYCNSACVFCTPENSSRLASEFKKIGIISELPPKAWSDDDAALSRFVETLQQTPRLAYLHFIGGETLITPSFLRILRALVAADLHHRTALGFTTNLTVWDTDVIAELQKFKNVNLGMSIECLHPLNDYVRYGSQIDRVLETMERWRALAKSQDWLLQLRITPTVLSIWHLDTVFQYALETGMAVESCNFLDDPDFMRPSVLPLPMRTQVIDRLQTFCDNLKVTDNHTIINIRDPNRYREQILQDAQSYVRYLESCEDESWRLPQLIQYLKQLEHSRGNCVLDYLPEYEKFFRAAGY